VHQELALLVFYPGVVSLVFEVEETVSMASLQERVMALALDRCRHGDFSSQGTNVWGASCS
jgi:hypothetical protein